MEHAGNDEHFVGTFSSQVVGENFDLGHVLPDLNDGSAVHYRSDARVQNG